MRSLTPQKLKSVLHFQISQGHTYVQIIFLELF